MKLFTTAALFAAALLFAALPGAAAPQNVVLGSGGEIYQLHLGYRSEIFPATSEEDTFLLALEVSHQDGTSELVVVPDTDLGDDIESTAALIYEESSETLFLVWDSRVNYIHSVLKLASFDGESWSEAITVRGGWLTPRGTPHLAVTRDKYDAVVDGEQQVVQRTVLHLAWWEGSDDGDTVLYSPIILENGEYIGSHGFLSMADLEESGEPGAWALLSDELLQTVSIRNGRDADTVLLGFADAATAQIRTVEIRPTPGAISSVADGLRPRLIEFGSTVNLRDDLEVLAAQARRDVQQLSNQARLNPGVRSHLAQQVYQLVATADPASLDLEELASSARDLIVELGNQFLSDRLLNVSDALRPRLIEFGQRSDGETPPHIFASRVLSSRPAPATPAAPTSMYLSADGQEALIAWLGEERLNYVESLADGWSEEASLIFGAGALDLESAYEILRQRAENR